MLVRMDIPKKENDYNYGRKRLKALFSRSQFRQYQNLLFQVI